MQSSARDVFYPLHQLHEPLFFARSHWGKTDTAISDNNGGHSMCARRLEQSIPTDLAVIVGVNVNKAGRHEHAVCIDNLSRLCGN